MSKLPGFMFYPGDWRKDPELSRATKAEKGMLIDLMCLMWECEDRGVLATAGIAWTDQEVGSAAGGDQTENVTLLMGLIRKGILRRNQAGAVFSARMVRDEAKRRMFVEAGKTGGNPALVRDKGRVKGHHKPQPSQSYSVAVSPSASEENPKTIPAGPPDQNSGNGHKKEPRAKWKEYLAAFTEKIVKKKGLKNYILSRREIGELARAYDQFGPGIVLACWEMAWEMERPWSHWGSQNGRSISWFCESRTLMTIMDDTRYKDKARRIDATLFGPLPETISLTKTEV